MRQTPKPPVPDPRKSQAKCAAPGELSHFQSHKEKRRHPKQGPFGPSALERLSSVRRCASQNNGDHFNRQQTDRAMSSRTRPAKLEPPPSRPRCQLAPFVTMQAQLGCAHTDPLCTPLRCSIKHISRGMFDGTSLRRSGFAPPINAAHAAFTGVFSIRRVYWCSL